VLHTARLCNCILTKPTSVPGHSAVANLPRYYFFLLYDRLKRRMQNDNCLNVHYRPTWQSEYQTLYEKIASNVLKFSLSKWLK
jgi:hypothetical protein